MPQFMKKNETHAILFGGYRERIAWSLGPNVFYNDMFILDVSNPDLVKWSKVDYDPNSLVPIGRSYECSVYSAQEDAFFLYGGLLYTSNFSTSAVLTDSWVYHFSTNSWTLLDDVAPAGPRSGHGCALDPSGENLIVTSGLSHNVSGNFYRDVWSWNLATNTWTNLTLTSLPPIGRWLFGFYRVPGTNNFLFLNGRLLRGVVVSDVWEFNGDTKQWTQFEQTNVPNPPHEVAAYALTSSKWILMAGGDADANKTVAETCLPPLICRTVVTPQDTNFFLRLKIDQRSAIWEDEAEFDHTVTRHRHAAIVIMKPYLYLYGGHDWDGTHGIGEIYNTHTWGLKLPNKYWD
jgi:N-acetylneuraminic acid mutarotase